MTNLTECGQDAQNLALSMRDKMCRPSLCSSRTHLSEQREAGIPWSLECIDPIGSLKSGLGKCGSL